VRVSFSVWTHPRRKEFAECTGTIVASCEASRSRSRRFVLSVEHAPEGGVFPNRWYSWRESFLSYVALQGPAAVRLANNSSRWVRSRAPVAHEAPDSGEDSREPIELRCGRGGFYSGFIPADREPSLTTVSALLRVQQTSSAWGLPPSLRTLALFLVRERR
jgi:hypothetical protein